VINLNIDHKRKSWLNTKIDQYFVAKAKAILETPYFTLRLPTKVSI